MKKIVSFLSVALATIVLAGCSGSGFIEPVAGLTPTVAPTTTLAPSTTPLAAASTFADVQGQVAMQIMTATTVPTDVPTDVPTVAQIDTLVPATATMASTVETWTQYPIVQYFDAKTVNGETFILVNGTTHAVSTANGKYDAVDPKPAGPQTDGKDLGWCKPGQIDCPPHTFLIRVTGTNNVCATAEMDISYRLRLVNNCNFAVSFRIELVFNTQTRTAAQLITDYSVMARKGDMGAFTMTESAVEPVATVTFDNKDYQAGGGCWYCLADTKGSLAPVPLSLADPSISQFGTPSVNPSSSIVPGVVISIPHPDKAGAGYMFDETISVPANGKMVWFTGRYDGQEPTKTATPIASAS